MVQRLAEQEIEFDTHDGFNRKGRSRGFYLMCAAS
jgi:hypothetical protein